ncbi:TIGR03621 family F420-dependent LLM class oxidoreductase [Nonomuraea typhae]|uniref:TIGR03621 family F420-dependent LLM class oxidoreductase n=1 Tax=Nonomuraea typhae TaxID=2603600 RepID=UPI0012F9004E|nr:TIGR03621 family F420-dependent LLM class oxidoreductase [Nonomuraea typhae]
MRPFRFGAVVRQADSAKAWAEQARRLEGTGFDVMLVPDHLVGERLAPIPALAAAAAATTRLRLGTMVLANDFRHPAALAKELATLDVLSDGRAEPGIGTGWMAGDYAAAGLPLDPPGVRLERLAEALAVLKGLWGEGSFTHHGAHYRVEGLDLYPKPVQRPRPPLLLAGGGPRLLRLAAREAASVNLTTRVLPDGSGPDPADGGLDAFLAKIALVEDAAPGPIELGTSILELGEAKAAAWSHADTSGLAATPQVLHGTRHDISDKLRHWRAEHGLTYFVLHHDRDLDAFAPIVEELA